MAERQIYDTLTSFIWEINSSPWVDLGDQVPNIHGCKHNVVLNVLVHIGRWNNILCGRMPYVLGNFVAYIQMHFLSYIILG